MSWRDPPVDPDIDLRPNIFSTGSRQFLNQWQRHEPLASVCTMRGCMHDCKSATIATNARRVTCLLSSGHSARKLPQKCALLGPELRCRK